MEREYLGREDRSHESLVGNSLNKSFGSTQATASFDARLLNRADLLTKEGLDADQNTFNSSRALQTHDLSGVLNSINGGDKSWDKNWDKSWDKNWDKNWGNSGLGKGLSGGLDKGLGRDLGSRGDVNGEGVSASPITQYVLTAFNDVCKKIDVIHHTIEKNNLERDSSSLDTMLVETREENEPEGWFKRLKKIFYGRNEEVPELESSDEPESVVLNLSAELDTLKQTLSGLKETYQEVQQEVRRVSAEAMFVAQKAGSQQQTSTDMAGLLNEVKTRLRLRKKELAEARAQLSTRSTAETALAKVASTVSSQIGRILVLMDKPECAESLHRELLDGNLHRLVGAFLDIEGHLREVLLKSEKIRSAKITSLEEKNLQLLQEIRKKEEETNALVRELDRVKEDKDAIINKQKLTIKLLQSKIGPFKESYQHAPKENRLLPISTDLSLAKHSYAYHSTPSTVSVQAGPPPKKPTSPIIEELEKRIGQLRSRLSSVDAQSPHYQAYLDEMEDCKRRLTDFLHI
ncbi:hypothetical protein NEHOM01_0960 [Nematocida homosporus]|uniref:uncharacterized protein n=1 Tax=Nematocida homosporus TaxID=1912981 RepID=UPI00221F28BA|nr:uncharacterized protein NEHOM01_0960 [Nematocida homosporus]KAI5185634.1 hypothetical protein NEHOM01_0960 [Nematocida homosporus]